MEDYGILSSKEVVIEFNDQQKDRIAAALQELVDKMPSTSQQLSPNPVKNELIELLSDEDEELKNDGIAIVSEETNICSDDDEEEVLGFLIYNSSNEAPEFLNSSCAAYPCEVIQSSISNIGAAAAPVSLEKVDKNSCIISSGRFLFESETESTLSAGEKSDVLMPSVVSPLTGSPTYSAHEVIELSESDLESDSDKHSDNSNDSNVKDRVSLKTKRRGAFDEYLKYYCPKCGIDCGCSSSWRQHTEKEHNFGSLEAPNMQIVATEQGKLSRRCRDCQKEFSINTGFTRLVLHSITHLPYPKYLGCRLCHFRYENKRLYTKHMYRNHGEITSLGAYKDDGALTYIRITCHVCKQQQNSVHDWNNHLKNEHDYHTKAKSKYVNIGNKYMCTLCGINIYLIPSLIIHMLSHEDNKTFSCTYCNNFQSSNLRTSKNHVRSNHLRAKKVRSFICTFCKSNFKSKQQRKIHYETEHKAQLKRCKVCKKGFDSTSYLLWHMNYANHHSS